MVVRDESETDRNFPPAYTVPPSCSRAWTAGLPTAASDSTLGVKLAGLSLTTVPWAIDAPAPPEGSTMAATTQMSRPIFAELFAISFPHKQVSIGPRRPRRRPRASPGLSLPAALGHT